MVTEIRLGSRKFYDDVHFAGGIERSGFFTIPEARFLVDYGYTLNGLFTGELTPDNDAESAFVTSIKSNDDCTLYEVKLWRKYLKALYKITHRASANSSRNENSRPFENYDEA